MTTVHNNATPPSRYRVAVVGGTGYVGRLLIRRLVRHAQFCVGPVVGSSHSIGRSLSDVWEAKETALVNNYGSLWEPLRFPTELEDLRVEGFEAVCPARCDFAVSCLSPEVKGVEDAIVDRGILLFSMSPQNRKDNAFVLELHAERFVREHASRRLYKSPNCVVCGTSIVLAALQQRYGLERVCITTMQSVSGRGDAMYSGERIVHNVMPVANSGEQTEACIRRELREILGMEDVSVRAYRVGVHVGHTVDVRVRTFARPASVQEVLDTLSGYEPLGEWSVVLSATPKSPIVLQHDRSTPQPRQRTNISVPCTNEEGMQVLVGNVSAEEEEDGTWSVALTLVVHNLIRGAYGAMLQLMEAHVALTDGRLLPL